ncbi:hypothetical protein B0T25DRAFT_295539 [Lasiosphaeria hispida]|uniref:Uncharacterized protein n=1 Tax=Lasiosphaeria hispida TaxID=260671 RepID=A0AAJ0HCM7_9PEZI|nr:hypothetical protein B0T25DRAFT_295539 [Lasiosphaeria hispida]
MESGMCHAPIRNFALVLVGGCHLGLHPSAGMLRAYTAACLKCRCCDGVLPASLDQDTVFANGGQVIGAFQAGGESWAGILEDTQQLERRAELAAAACSTPVDGFWSSKSGWSSLRKWRWPCNVSSPVPSLGITECGTPSPPYAIWASAGLPKAARARRERMASLPWTETMRLSPWALPDPATLQPCNPATIKRRRLGLRQRCRRRREKKTQKAGCRHGKCYTSATAIGIPKEREGP